MSDTVRYYDSNAARFVEGTLRVDMSGLHARLLSHCAQNVDRILAQPR